MQFSPKAKLDTEKIPILVQESNGEIRFQNGEKPALLYKKRNAGTPEAIEKSMEKALEISEFLRLV